MKEKGNLKRYILCVVGLMIAGFGVAVTKKGALGVSPISSVANVLSIRVDMLTLGNWLIIWNCVLIVGQVVILRKKFQPFQLLQIPLSFLFGIFTDVGMKLISGITVESYWMQLAMVILGTVILGYGISISVLANVILNSGEAFVKAISDTFHKDFGNLKVGFDVTCVVLAVILSMVFFDLKIEGTREGTIIAALLTGMLVKKFVPINRKLLRI